MSEHCGEGREFFRLFENNRDANKTDDEGADERVKASESDNTNFADLGDEIRKEAESSMDENDCVCICNYCGNWFSSQESLLIHLRENHLLNILPSNHMQYGSKYSISI